MLHTDIAFHRALSANTALMQIAGQRIYNTAIPLPDEDLPNVPVPYIIVTFDGLTNDAGSKDDPFEGDSDTVTIGVEVTATSRAALADLMQTVRDTIHDYFVERGDVETDIPDDYQLSASAVQYDAMKPCFWQMLTYQCDTHK